MKKLLVVLMVFIASTVSASNYIEDPIGERLPGDIQHSVGFTAGGSHGSGIHYQRIPDEDWGYMITGIPLWVDEERFLSAGFAAIRNINQGKKGRLFFTVGVGFTYSREQYYNWNAKTGVDENIINTNYNYLFGPGIGITRVWAENFGIEFSLPACIMIRKGKSIQILPIPNLSVSYTWR